MPRKNGILDLNPYKKIVLYDFFIKVQKRIGGKYEKIVQKTSN